MMDYKQMIVLVKDYAISIFQSKDLSLYPYHNLTHTTEVVRRIEEISSHYNLSEEECFIVQSAGWFHDTGYLFVEFAKHEEESIRIMYTFLTSLNMPDNVLCDITNCILATKYPPEPKNLLEQIICDADTYHFGTELFRKTDPLIKTEMEIAVGKKIDNWIEGSIRLLQNHIYFTSYCQHLLNKGKSENIKWLQTYK